MNHLPETSPVIDHDTPRLPHRLPPTLIQALAASVSERHRIQVIPEAARTYHHLDGPFILAVVDGRELAFLSTAARGFVIEDRDVVSQLRWRWDTIRSEALPVGQSVELIEKAAQQWT